MPNFTTSFKPSKPYPRINMSTTVLLPMFFANIRGWQLILIILVFLLFFVLIPGIFGFVLGRRTSGDKTARRRRCK